MDNSQIHMQTLMEAFLENVQFYLTLNIILCTILTVLAQCALCVLMSTHFNLHRRILKPLLLKARLDASTMMNAYIGTNY